jgi:transposase
MLSFRAKLESYPLIKEVFVNFVQRLTFVDLIQSDKFSISLPFSSFQN